MEPSFFIGHEAGEDITDTTSSFLKWSNNVCFFKTLERSLSGIQDLWRCCFSEKNRNKNPPWLCLFSKIVFVLLIFISNRNVLFIIFLMFLTFHEIHNLSRTIWNYNRRRPSHQSNRIFEPRGQKLHDLNNRGDIVWPLRPKYHNPGLSSLFCKYKNRRHKIHVQNKLGQDNRLFGKNLR